jgi:hypothetical protein
MGAVQSLRGGVEPTEGQAIRAELWRVFYPDREDWRRQVRTQGQEVVGQAHDFLGAESDSRNAIEGGQGSAAGR